MDRENRTETDETRSCVMETRSGMYTAEGTGGMKWTSDVQSSGDGGSGALHGGARTCTRE